MPYHSKFPCYVAISSKISLLPRKLFVAEPAPRHTYAQEMLPVSIK